jgi:3-hydroxybutyryl-CoA dehydratase
MSFTDFHLYYDDMKVGQEWESQGRTVTEADLVNFAGLSGDFNPIHMDAEFARKTPFRARIAHGALVFALGSGLGASVPPVRTIAIKELLEWHFREPVFIGDTVHLRSRVVDIAVRARGRRAIVTWQRQIVNQHGKVVQEGRSVTLVEGRAAARGASDGDKLDESEKALEFAAQT